MRVLIAAVFLSISFAQLAWAQAPQDSWDNLKQLRPGMKIAVVDVNWRLTKGKFVGVSDEAITVREGKNVLQITRADLLQVGRQKSRWRSVGIGALIAGAASGGFFLPIAFAAAEPAAFVATGIISAGTAGFGGAIGASLPPGYRPIYQAKVQAQEARKNPTETQAGNGAQESEWDSPSAPW